MADCIFCQIASKKIPSYQVYEDNDFLAFLDISPFSWGHTLVIPKKHYPWVWDVPNIGEYFQVCQKIAKHYQKVLNQEMIISHVYGIDVLHAHIHLVPNLNNYTDLLEKKLGDLRQPQLTPSKAQAIVKKLQLVNSS